MSLSITTVTAGDTATMTCTTTLDIFSSYSSGKTTVTVQLLRGVQQVGSTVTTTGTGATRTGLFTISNMNTSSADSYQCRATVEYIGVNEQFVMEPSPTDSTAASLTVQSKLLC